MRKIAAMAAALSMAAVAGAASAVWLFSSSASKSSEYGAVVTKVDDAGIIGDITMTWGAFDGAEAVGSGEAAVSLDQSANGGAGPHWASKNGLPFSVKASHSDSADPSTLADDVILYLKIKLTGKLSDYVQVFYPSADEYASGHTKQWDADANASIAFPKWESGKYVSLPSLSYKDGKEPKTYQEYQTMLSDCSGCVASFTFVSACNIVSSASELGWGYDDYYSTLVPGTTVKNSLTGTGDGYSISSDSGADYVRKVGFINRTVTEGEASESQSIVSYVKQSGSQYFAYEVDSISKKYVVSSAFSTESAAMEKVAEYCGFGSDRSTAAEADGYFTYIIRIYTSLGNPSSYVTGGHIKNGTGTVVMTVGGMKCAYTFSGYAIDKLDMESSGDKSSSLYSLSDERLATVIPTDLSGYTQSTSI